VVGARWLLVAGDSPSYIFRRASRREIWVHHITPTPPHEKLIDLRIARLLGVLEETYGIDCESLPSA